MSIETLAGLGLAFSLGALGLLAWRDPKRRRGLDQHTAAGRAERQVLALLALLPGLSLAIGGIWPAVLLWAGGVSAGGWALVQAFGQRAIRD